MGRAGKIGVQGVDDWEIRRMEPELAELRRGGSLFSPRGGGAQRQVDWGKQMKLAADLEGGQESPGA